MKWNDDSIEAYLSGELDKSQALAFARHLQQHPAEAAKVEEQRRVRDLLSLAAPEVPTQRMWSGIRARIAAGEGFEAAPENSLWNRFLVSLNAPSLRWGFAGAAALLLAVGLHISLPEQSLQPPALLENKVDARAEEIKQPVAREASIEPEQRRVASKAAAKASAPEARRPPAASFAEVMEPKGLTEVERALADQDVNQAMNTMLVEKERMGSRPYLAAPSLAASTVSLGNGPGQPERVRSSAGLPYPSAQIMPRQLLSRTGLNVQQADRSQYFPESRVAIYSGAVVARLATLRSEGDALQLNLGVERISFSPGTHFVRLAGALDNGSEASIRVIGSDGSEISDNEFNAPRGAEYLRSSGELRLK